MDNFLLAFILGLSYIICIFIVQYLGIGSKKKCANSNNCCPDCKSNLSRIKRLSKDKLNYYLSLGMIDWRRYSCEKCGWQGLRWTKPHDFKRN